MNTYFYPLPCEVKITAWEGCFLPQYLGQKASTVQIYSIKREHL